MCAVKNDVVTVATARADARHSPAADIVRRPRGLAVGVRLIFVGIEHLNFVQAHEEDAAIAALLAFAHRRSRLGEFDVELAVAESSRDEMLPVLATTSM